MDGHRLTRAFRGWRHRAGRLSLDRRAWWEHADGETMAFGAACFTLVSCIPIEATLWGTDWGPAVLRTVDRVPGEAVLGSLAVLWMAGAWIFDGLLLRRLAEPCRPCLAYRLTRAVVIGFPGFGLLSLLFWRRIATESWPVAYPRERARRRSSPPRTPIRLLPASTEWSGRAAMPLWICGFLAFLVGLLWLAAPREPTAGRRVGLMAAATGLHLIGLAGSWISVTNSPGQGDTKRLRLWALFWLLPLPLSFGALIPMGLEARGGRSSTLVWHAFARRGQETQLDTWAGLERSIRRSWRAEAWWRRWRRPIGYRIAPACSAGDRRLLTAGRIHLATLPCDALLLAWSLHRTGHERIGQAVSGGALFVCSAALLVGVVVFSGRLAATVLRVAPEPSPCGLHRQIWFGSLGIAGGGIGCVAGSTYSLGRHHEAMMLLVLGTALVQVFIGLGLMLRSVFMPWYPESAGAGFGWWGVLALFMFAVASTAPILPVAATLFALSGHGAALASMRTYVHWRRAFERSRVSRWSDAAALVMALLPLGGLAAPLWLRLGGGREPDMGKGTA